MCTMFRRRLMTAAVLSLLLESGCDPRRALEPGEGVETGPTTPVMGIAGQVVNAATGASVAGARVQVLRVGSATTSDKGGYQFGEVAALAGREFLSLRVEAPGYAPVERRVDLVSGGVLMPIVLLSPLSPAMPIGPEGGEITLFNGVQVRAPAGAVGVSVRMGVTMLANGAYGQIKPDAPGEPDRAFHVSPEGTHFTRPVRISIPLEQPAVPLSTVALYSFHAETGSWIQAGSATVSTDGRYVEAAIDNGDTYVFQVVQDWGSEQVTTNTVAWYASWINKGCVPPNTPITVDTFTETTRFSTSVRQASFHNFYAHLKTLYDYSYTVAGKTLGGNYVKEQQVYVRRVYLKEWRKGRVWLLANPANKTTYTHVHYTFVGWQLVHKDCDPQGLVV
jgi:hypothetical protein